MRQKVAARRFWSSRAAIVIARITCGTLEKTKIENVLTRDFQKTGWARTAL